MGTEEQLKVLWDRTEMCTSIFLKLGIQTGPYYIANKKSSVGFVVRHLLLFAEVLGINSINT